MAFKTRRQTLQDIAFLVVTATFFIFFRLNTVSLASWDEGVYAVVAKELLHSGDWLHLTYGGEPWLQKAPLVVWVTASFYKIFGVHEFSARLFSALCGFATVIVTYYLGKKILGRWGGFCAAMVLLTSSHFLHFSRFGVPEAPFTFFTTLAFLFFWMGHDRNRYLIFSGIAIGLATLVKGYIALWIFPAIWIYCIWGKELEVIGRSSYWIGVIIAVMIALPWNLFEAGIYRQITPGHSPSFFPIETQLANFYYYIRMFINKFHPWALIGIFSAPFFLWKAIREKELEARFLSAWIFFFLIGFTINATKRDGYILPLYPAVCVTIAYFLVRIFSENNKNIMKAVFVVILILHIPYSHIFSHTYSDEVRALRPFFEEKKLPKETKIYLYNYDEAPAARFYFDRDSRSFWKPEDLAAAMSKDANFVCVVQKKHWSEIAALFQGTHSEIFTQGDLLLAYN